MCPPPLQELEQPEGKNLVLLISGEKHGTQVLEALRMHFGIHLTWEG